MQNWNKCKFDESQNKKKGNGWSKRFLVKQIFEHGF